MAALLVSVALAALSACGGGAASGAGRNAPTYPIEITVAGLDEGTVRLSNGLDVIDIDANPDGLAADRIVTLNTQLPAGAGYDLRIVNDPLAEFALQCDVLNGQGTMPAQKVDSAIVRCARVKSVRRLAGILPADVQSRDGLATDARFLFPRGIVVDSAGNVYVADSGGSTIRRITPTGVVSTFAGSARLTGASDGTGVDARFDNPSGIAIDGHDNLYVADTGNNAIRRITPKAEVSTIAGVTLLQPHGVAVDAAANLYVADTGANAIRRIGAGGSVTRLAEAATFSAPQGIAVDGAGNVYVADTNSATTRLRRIAPDGSVSTLANDGLSLPSALAIDAAGQLTIADTGNDRIRVLSPAGVLTTLAGGTTRTGGPDDGTGTDARFSAPQGVALDGKGNVYVADTNGQTVRIVIPATGAVSTRAGRSTTAGYRDGDAADAQLSSPAALAVDADGTVYVADTNNNSVRQVSKVVEAGRQKQVVRTLLGSATEPAGPGGDSAATVRLNAPRGLALDAAGSLYIADTDNNRVLRLTKGHRLEIFAVSLNQPRGLVVDRDGRLYVADTGSNTIRRVTADGLLERTYGGAELEGVDSLALDSTGRLFATNRALGIVLRIATDSGAITIVAGSPGLTGPYVDEPGAATNARFDAPAGIVIDAADNLYVADSNHRVVRVLNALPDGTYRVRTVTGDVTSVLTRTGALPQPIGLPKGLALSAKRLYLTTGDAVLFVDR